MHFGKTLLLAAAFPLALGAQGESTTQSASPDSGNTVTSPPSSPEQGGLNLPPAGFSGTVFGRYTLRGGEAGQGANSFNLDRAYVTYRAQVSDRASARVTTDIFTPASSLGGSGYDVRLRYAYLQYDYLRGANWNATARFGLVHQAFIDHEQNFWPRWVAPTAVEQAGLFPVSDFGAATLISMPNRWGEIYAAVTNGTGEISGDEDRFKDYQARVSFTPLARSQGYLSSFSLTGWYYRGSMESNIANVGNALKNDSWGAFVGVRDPRLTIGVDYAENSAESDALAGTPAVRTVTSTDSRLISAYVVAHPLQAFNPANTIPLGVIVRYDQTKPDKDADPTFSQFIGGVTWDFTKRVAFGLDYQEMYGNEAAAIASTNTYNLRWVVNF